MTAPGEETHPPASSASQGTWRRFLGFTLLPAIAAISPLLVLPFVARVAGPDGWASALAGEAIGTFAAIALAYGWTTIGPAIVAIASARDRGRIYRESLIVRSTTSAVVLPATVVLCIAVATPGHETLAALMGLQGALIAMSYTWFAVGLGRPSDIAYYDALPRLGAAGIVAAVIAAGAPVEVYPIAGILVTLIGTGLYTRRVLHRFPAQWPPLKRVPLLFRQSAPVAVNEAAMGFYSSVPVPAVNLTTPGQPAAGFASADKLTKLGQFVPLTLANALQNWTGEPGGMSRARRLRIALLAHAVLAITGMVLLGALGGWVSSILFGPEATAPSAIYAILGLAFACFTMRTSMIRHLLFPSGGARTVMVATLVASALGVPAMILLTQIAGPVGAAIGYTSIELLSTLLLVPGTRRAYVASRVSGQ